MNEQKNEIQSLEPSDALQRVFGKVEIVRNLIKNKDKAQLEQLGFNQELFPIMEKFLELAPRILGTFSHPTELDVYKIVAAKKLIQLCKKAGISPDLITVMQLDTRPINDSSIRPLGISQLGPNKENDPLGISGEASPEDTINLLVDQLEVQITQILKDKGIGKEGKKLLKAAIKTKLLPKLQNLLSLKPNFSSKSKFQNIQSESLIFNRNLAAALLQGTDGSEVVLEKIGEELLSESCEYRAFILDVIKMLIEMKGIGLIKQIGSDGKGLAQIVINGEILQLKVNTENQFVLMQGSNFKGIVSDDEFLNTIEFGLPLGKLESLALTICGQTIHYGSSHGENMKSIQALGITGEAAKLLEDLQIGEDGTQGHDGLVVGRKFVSLPLLLLLLSKEKVMQIIDADQAITFENIERLKFFFADELIQGSINTLNNES